MKTIEKPSNLQNHTLDQIKNLAEDIASESFIVNGNKQIAFTANDELRNLMGGRWSSYKELSLVVIAAYNNKYSQLILANI